MCCCGSGEAGDMDTYLTESFLSPNTGVCGNISMHVNPYGERAAAMPFNPTFFSMSGHVCSVQTHVNRHGEREFCFPLQCTQLW